MRNKYPRKDTPLIAPNLDLCFWVPGYGQHSGSFAGVYGNSGSFGIIDPGDLSFPALQNSSISNPLDISTLLNLPSTYQDRSIRPLCLYAANSDGWMQFSLIVKGLDLNLNEIVETIPLLARNFQQLSVNSFSYIESVMIYDHTGFLATLPDGPLFFDPGQYGLSRIFIPNPKNTSFGQNNSLQVNFFDPAGSQTVGFAYYVYGSNMPLNVNANTGPLTGPQIDKSYLANFYNTSFHLPGWVDILTSTGADIPLEVVQLNPLGIVVNGFYLEMTRDNSPNTTLNLTEDGISGYIIFNQFGQWFN
jgi:hypothetical protein